MAERRSSRPRKRVDYVKLAVEEDSDDDFAGGSPPCGPPQKKRNCPKEAQTCSTNSQGKAGKDPASPQPSSLTKSSCKETSSKSVLLITEPLPSKEEPKLKVVCSPLKSTDVDVPLAENGSFKSTRRKPEKKLAKSSSEDETASEDETGTEDSTSESDENAQVAELSPVKVTKLMPSKLEKRAKSESPKPKKNVIPDAAKVVGKSNGGVSRTLQNNSIKVEPQRLSSGRIASSGSAGIRLGLSRNARVKSLHPAVKVGPH